VSELVSSARLPEEPGAVIPHAGICEGASGETGVHTSIGKISNHYHEINHPKTSGDDVCAPTIGSITRIFRVGSRSRFRDD